MIISIRVTYSYSVCWYVLIGLLDKLRVELQFRCLQEIRVREHRTQQPGRLLSFWHVHLVYYYCCHTEVHACVQDSIWVKVFTAAVVFYVVRLFVRVVA